MPEICTQTEKRKRVYQPVHRKLHFKEQIRRFVQSYMKTSDDPHTFMSFKTVLDTYTDVGYTVTNEIHFAKEVAIAMKEIFPNFIKDRTRKAKGYRGVELQFP